ncbi:hypothetical protein FRB96_005044 [Tulasnella sp. 330]|nr:hypothetical protein FRB96_005044 [Tulasnella sp. 330]KAG8872813.1 hypothetical protein FRB97_007339 [Tulasnella sp. 331]KAG8890397.1 hypothetical protein FRB98_008972 [Tulasnella sp. 332]
MPASTLTKTAGSTPASPTLRAKSPDDFSLAPTALTGVTHWTQMPVMPSPDQVRDVLASMKDTLENLGVTFDTLGQHSQKVAGIEFEYNYDEQISSLRKHMSANEKKQEKRMDDLKTLLRDVLKDEIVPHIRTKMDHGIANELEKSVKSGISREVARNIPQRLQDQIIEDSQQLMDLEINLHNSEARRANALIRSNHLNDPLHPLLTSEGVVSPGFPRDLSQLFGLDDDAAMELNDQYGLTDIVEGKERNLNRFMQLCGISYQMTPFGGFELRSDSLPEGIRMYHLIGSQGSNISDYVARSPTPTSEWSEGEEEYTDDDASYAPRPDTDSRDRFGLQFLGGFAALTAQLMALYLLTTRGPV